MDTLEPFQLGQRPWLPHAEAYDLDAWHVWDIPLVGSFRLKGAFWVFECPGAGFDPDPALWEYYVLPWELQCPMFNDMREFDTWLDAAFIQSTGHRKCYAVNDEIIAMDCVRDAGLSS